MSENYLVINGKKMDLTEEQLKALGIEPRKNPFDRVNYDETYYCIDSFDIVVKYSDICASLSDKLQDVANYFNDKDFAHQVALHQLLYRKLLKFAYDNGCEDTAEWNTVNQHWCIRYAYDTKSFVISVDYYCNNGAVYFSSDEAAKRAAREVIVPFMNEHPEFKW